MVAAPGAWEALQKTRKLRRLLSGHRSYEPMTFFSLSPAWGWANCGAHESIALFTHEALSIDWTAPIAKLIGSANSDRAMEIDPYGYTVSSVDCSSPL